MKQKRNGWELRRISKVGANLIKCLSHATNFGWICREPKFKSGQYKFIKISICKKIIVIDIISTFTDPLSNRELFGSLHNNLKILVVLNLSSQRRTFSLRLRTQSIDHIELTIDSFVSPMCVIKIQITHVIVNESNSNPMWVWGTLSNHADHGHSRLYTALSSHTHDAHRLSRLLNNCLVAVD